MMLELTHYGGVAPVKPLRINTQFLYRAGESDPPPLSICIMSSRRPVAIETRLNGDIVNYLERTTADPFSCINCNIAVIRILVFEFFCLAWLTGVWEGWRGWSAKLGQDAEQGS